MPSRGWEKKSAIEISQNSLPRRLLPLPLIAILLDTRRLTLQSLPTLCFLSRSSDPFKKIGDYFRCATRLYRTIVQSHNTRKQFSHIDVVAIDPPGARVSSPAGVLVLYARVYMV
jgi:hypothetical protein